MGTSIPTRRSTILILYFLGLLLPLIGFAQPTRVDSIHYNHSELTTGSSGSLYVRDSVATAKTCGYTIKKATINAYLNLGSIYKYGSTSFTGTVDVTIQGYSTFTGSSGLVSTYTSTLSINQDTPEKLYLQDFTSDHASINRFVISLSNYSASAAIQDSIQLAFYYREEFGIDVRGVTLSNNTVTSGNPVAFNWHSNCEDVPDYELQVLRLYNRYAPYSGNEYELWDTIDWNRALTIETMSRDTALSLTLTEGSGYYVWRVRPVGTLYSGGIAHSRNWGTWTGYAQGTVLTTSPSASYGFFYTQFDDSLNWIYRRTFSEGDLAASKVKISEQMTFANGLQQVKQSQAYLQTENQILINQTVYDYSGRAALTTMPAPVDTTKLGYRKEFITAGSALYTAAHFDEDSNFNNPDAIDGGPLNAYYSNSNTDPSIPNAEGYPFSRALYERDGTGRVREQGGPGETHRIKTSNDHTTKTYYSGVSDAELIHLFGDEAPDATSVHKTLAIDANKTASISYMDKEGKTIATCLSIGTDNGTILDTLDSQQSFTVQDTLLGNSPYGNYGISSKKPMAFATATAVTLNYSITAKEIEHMCTNYCRTCDYTIEFLIRGDDSTQIITHSLNAISCGTTNGYQLDTTINLDAGSYIFEKRVYANNTDAASATDTTNAFTFLEEHLNSLRDSLQAMADDSLSIVYDFLSRSSMDSLYDYLNPGMDLNQPDTVFVDSLLQVNIGCGSINIPVNVCPKHDCSSSTPDFEGYFDARWDGTSYVGTSAEGYLNYLDVDSNRFTPGQFNFMIKHMINDGYDCDTLWECWDRVTQNYGSLKSMSDTMPEYKFDLLVEFLNCAGREYTASSTDTAEYRGYAYKYFFYNNSSFRSDNLFKTMYGDTSTWAQDSLYGLPQNKVWELYSTTINHMDTTSTLTAFYAKAKAEAACMAACELRYDGFVSSLIQMYHNDSVYVEGDRYYLTALSDTLLGQTYGWSNTKLPGSFPSGFSNYKDSAEIKCAARNLVEYSQQSCLLTVYRNTTDTNYVDSVGSTAEIEAMKQAMTWNYDLKHVSDGQSCGTGYTKVGPQGTADTNLAKIWDKHYGGDNFEKLGAMAEAKQGSGGYAFVGTTESSLSYDVNDTLKGSDDIWIVKVNNNGDIEWKTMIGSSNSMHYGISILEASDGGFMVGGYNSTYYWGGSYYNIQYKVVKLDKNGKIEWSNNYYPDCCGDGDGYLTSSCKTADGYFLFGGYANNYSHGGYDYWILKVDGAGNEIWGKNFGTASDDIMMTVKETKQGTYLLGGYTEGGASYDKTESSQGGSDYWMVEIDTGGTKIMDKSFGGSGNDYLYDLEIADDSSYVLAGGSASDNDGDRTTTTFGGYDYWVIKVDNDEYGTKLWDSAYGGSDNDGALHAMCGWDQTETMKIKKMDDGTYLVGGNSCSGISGDKTESNRGNEDYWLIHIDANGNKVWDKTYGGNIADVFSDHDQDEYGYYWIGGFSSSDSSSDKTCTNYGNYDFWVLKARDVCSHDSICIKWVDNTVVETDSNTITFTPISCDSMAAGYVYNSIQMQVGKYIQQQLDDFKEKYTATCANPDSIQDTLVMTYNLGYHHYTLYYYDRAGNLVRTVPPKGVDLSSTCRMQHPAHTYVTKYNYNSLHQLVQQYTPDGDTTDYWYDYKGQLRFSRNAKQKLESVYSYTKYDDLGRIIEVGESNLLYSSFYDYADVAVFPTSGNSQRTYTVYNDAYSGALFIGNIPQRYLQNRVSYVYNDDGVYTFYSYDPHGNVEWLIQDIPELGRSYLRYEYDLVSNKVLAVHYNEGMVDEYHHRYTYDADQRILTTETSWGTGGTSPAGGTEAGWSVLASETGQTHVGWDRDAKYTYYKHGPLKRTEIGEDNIQGLDYVYTINGWLKGINYPTLNPADDPGGDDNTTFASDAFGMVLGYHSNDFNRTGSKYNPSTASLVSSQTTGLTDLYNGNISSWTLQGDTISGNYAGQMGFKYRYDQLNRIKKEDYNSYAGSSWSTTTDYDSRYTYDANGNLDTLIRNGYASLHTDMDNFKYNYLSETNKLTSVDDAVASGNYSTDIDDQSANNYQYDAIGNMAKDVQAGIDTILWNVYGKVKTVKKSNGDSLNFVYDAMGNNVQKIDKPYSGTTTTTYYVHDASGNVMSIYERAYNGNDYDYRQKEIPLYGSDRIGAYKPNKLIRTENTFCFTCEIYHSSTDLGHVNGLYARAIDKKEYEMKDHLSNIRATVGDRKWSDGTADIKSYINYYAFGSELVGKTYNSTSTRFGFNGYEKDDEWRNKTGADYNFNGYGYDALTIRRKSPDPLYMYNVGMSPYAFANNNPIWFYDYEGLISFSRVYKGYTFSFDTDFPQQVKIITSKQVINLSLQGASSPSIRLLVDFTSNEFDFESKDYKTITKKLKTGETINGLLTEFLKENPDIELGIVGNHNIQTGDLLYVKKNPQVFYGNSRTGICCDYDSPFLSDRGKKLKKGLFGDLPNVKIYTRYDFPDIEKVFKLFPETKAPVLLLPKGMDPVGTTLFFNFSKRDEKKDVLEEKQPKPKSKPMFDCFVVGTFINMSDGTTKPIEQVKIGDKIWSVDLTTMQIEEDKVLKINSPIHEDIIVITFDDGTENRNTSDHPYYVKNKGWSSYKLEQTLSNYGIKANQLAIGDLCYKYSSGKLIETAIKTISESKGNIQTYNLSLLEKNNTYFANGMLVSNESNPVIEKKTYSAYEYLINEMQDTIGSVYYLLVNGDTINKIDTRGKKQGFWMEYSYAYGVREEGNYINDLKDGEWKGYSQKDGILIEKSQFEKGWLKEQTHYGCYSAKDTINIGKGEKGVLSSLKLNEKENLFIYTLYYDCNGKIQYKNYFKVPDRKMPFNGFGEGFYKQYLIKSEKYDETGKLIMVTKKPYKK